MDRGCRNTTLCHTHPSGDVFAAPVTPDVGCCLGVLGACWGVWCPGPHQCGVRPPGGFAELSRTSVCSDMFDGCTRATLSICCVRMGGCVGWDLRMSDSLPKGWHGSPVPRSLLASRRLQLPVCAGRELPARCGCELPLCVAHSVCTRAACGTWCSTSWQWVCTDFSDAAWYALQERVAVLFFWLLLFGALLSAPHCPWMSCCQDCCATSQCMGRPAVLFVLVYMCWGSGVSTVSIQEMVWPLPGANDRPTSARSHSLHWLCLHKPWLPSHDLQPTPGPHLWAAPTVHSLQNRAVCSCFLSRALMVCSPLIGGREN